MRGKKLLALAAAAVTALSAGLFAPACSTQTGGLLEENIIDDKYDNYYEIFVYSFNDSDGDGIGDLNGVTQKLDYIRDMGYTGIWLMPIHKSPSYHKYDVTDYRTVDEQYGTIEDYQNLVSAAHERGIKVIIDLVLNHTSTRNSWFLQAVSAVTNGTESQYYDWYNFVDTPTQGYAQWGGTDVYYEARFDSGMPDLNLDNPEVREELSSVMEFWLNMGTDGFRLDACTSYYTDSMSKSIAFCDWVKKEAVSYNPDAYIVGEVWSDIGTISSYYSGSDADSFFCFPASQASGYVNQTLLSFTPADYFWNSVKNVANSAGDGIAAPFLGNHDTGRIAGTLWRRAERIKFAYGLLSMYSGNTFTYYGDEIGMVGSANDPDKRIGMLWDNEGTNLTNPPPGSTTQEYEFDGVAEQLADENSILNYYKKCNNARNAFPALMRGQAQRVDYSDEYILAFTKTYGDETITVVINFAEEQKTVSGIAGDLAQTLCVEGEITQQSGQLTMPSYSIAILKN